MRVRCRTSRMALPIASRYSSAVRSSSRATSSEPRRTVSGVRSSCETSAMNCCCSFSAEASASRRALSRSATRRAPGLQALRRDPNERPLLGLRETPFEVRERRRLGRRAGRRGDPRRRACRTGRPPSLRRPSGLDVPDAIADAANGLDQLLPLAAVDLLAQRVDVDVDDVGRKIEGVLPDPGLDLGARDDLAPPAQQQLEERPLADGQPDGLASARRPRATRARRSGRRTRAAPGRRPPFAAGAPACAPSARGRKRA